MVSNHYQVAPLNANQPWPLIPGHIHPPRLIQPLQEFRVRPTELEGDQLCLFVPRAPEVDQQKDQRLYGLAKIIAETVSTHGAATAIMQLEPWDFMAVYYDAIDHFGHGFMRYHPPRSSWIDEKDFEIYHPVIESAYCFHDAMLGTLLALAGEETTVILVSDHGFHPDRLRPQHLPNEPTGPAAEHRPFGIVALKGPGIKADEVLYGSSLLDITPTILSLFGLPVGQDMDGKVLATAFITPPIVTWIDSWDQVPGDAAQHPPDLRVDAVESQAAIEHLAELGYIEELNPDEAEQVKETVRELRYNLAQSYAGANLDQEAIPIFAELWEAWPEEGRFGTRLFQSLLALNRCEEARQVLTKLRERKALTVTQATERLTQLLDRLKDKEPSDYSPAERRTVQKLQGKIITNQAAFAFFEGSLLAAEGSYEAALAQLEQAKGVQTHHLPSLYHQIGEVYAAQKNWSQAESHLCHALEYDPVNPDILLSLSQIYLRQHRNQEALEQGMAAIGLQFHNPIAHFCCGVAFQRLGQVQEAEQALCLAVAQNPIFPAAHRRLSLLYHWHKPDLEKAALHRRLSRQSRQRLRLAREGTLESEITPATIADWYSRSAEKRQQVIPPLSGDLNETIVVVSGLPRSGTSMMMQMLERGGLPILSDGMREADVNNPKGYHELERVKQLPQDNQWLGEAKGKGVKIIAQLLPHLNLAYSYRIIFMERHLQEVIRSQRKMLQRLRGNQPQTRSDEQLAQTFLQQLLQVDRWVENHPQVAILYVNYEQVLHNSTQVTNQINQFLGQGLNESAMIQAVVPQLRHEDLVG
jgi:tetratricopeptide (TPR) repeat protein